MKKLWGLIALWLGVIAGFTSIAHSSQTCNKADFLCFESGPTGNLATPFRVDSAGNITIAGTSTLTGNATALGTIATPSNIIQGTVGTGTSNAVAANTSLAIPVSISTNVLQGHVIVTAAATTQNPTLVSGTYATTTGATTVLGVADVAGSSGTVINVDYSGIAVVLATGTVSVGDILVSSSNATSNAGGFAGTNNSAAVGTVIGTALAANTSAASPALIRVLLHH